MAEIKKLGDGSNGFMARFEAQHEINIRRENEIGDIFDRLQALEREGAEAMTEIKNISKALVSIEGEVKKITEWKYTISGALIVLNIIIVTILVPLAWKVLGAHGVVK